ncbi:hypothetical protein GXN76_03285 [Kroppenstedtia pulmonis]|uniref:Tetratricopeptide repeat protein n=1 Tax=Kroppenstedtia pulmonis TaxID=1380685 RepID=A0A7D4BIF6_9BACL|nr:hypothetical protein [Kroppenstedtia pulmonis]QKG83590.1 hypothetical protein GXN76_03285 [Kroppenstedtia pulmonis]
MVHVEVLKQQAMEKVSHLLPKDIFNEFDNLNSRMLVAVTCLQRGEKELAYGLFESIAAHGPSENENRQFAFVRSLVEMAEMDAEKENFRDAVQKMSVALASFPEGMNYMMSRTHLDVYLTYYRFRLGERDQAKEELQNIILREKKKFAQYKDPEEGRNLLGPALCYAIHQQALFYGEEKEWEQAVKVFEGIRDYAGSIDERGWKEAEEMKQDHLYEEAFQCLTESTFYEAG